MRSHIALPPGAQLASPRMLVADPDVELLARIDVHPQ
jgi:hypothetical protein